VTRIGLIVLACLACASCSDDSKQPVPDKGIDRSVVDGPKKEAATPDKGPASQELVILHTNDVHGQVEGWSPISEYTPDATGDDGTVGGFARVAALIKSERAAAGSTPVLVLDAGDFMMGSLFDLLATTKGAELKLMDQMGYDAATIGNHEFDWKPLGLAAVLGAATTAGAKFPILAPANMVFDSTSTEDDALAQLVTSGAMKKKLVKTLSNGLTVGIFALMGKDAASVAYGAPPVTFGDAATAAKAMVKELREQDKVSLVICLSHLGIETDGKGEDATLAAAAPGIDVIVSGHSHTALTAPVKVDSTLIVQAGAHGKHLGKLGLKVQGTTVSMTKGELLAVDDKVKGDGDVQTAVTGAIADIDAALTAASTGLTYKKVLAETSFDLTFPAYQEAIMGNIIVDGYLSIAKALQPTEPADIAVDSGGVIGDAILKGKAGKIWFADVYRAVPKGIGPDAKPGYPLVSFHINGKEVRAGMEVLAMAQGFLKSNSYFFQVAGMQVEYQKAGLPMGSVTSIKIGNPPVAIDMSNTTTCYKMVTNLLVANQLSQVKTISGGLLSIEPKDKDCTTKIADLTTRIVDRDPVTAGVQELKAWQAVATYLSKLPDTNANSVPDVPDAYKTLQNRIVGK
jgi:5'-nucleotidase